MSFQSISSGENPPEDINVIIEIPAYAPPIKYEVDKHTDAIWVDRFVATCMQYPANYGYINNTLADDGDPVDVLVVTPHPLMVGSVIRSRPIGVLRMQDDGGVDAKVLAVAHTKLTPIYKNISSVNDMPLLKEQVQHYFEQYKALEPGKWVKIDGWYDAAAAAVEIMHGIKQYQ